MNGSAVSLGRSTTDGLAVPRREPLIVSVPCKTDGGPNRRGALGAKHG